MAGGVRLGLTSQTIVATSYRGLTGFLLEIPPDHIQLTVMANLNKSTPIGLYSMT